MEEVDEAGEMGDVGEAGQLGEGEAGGVRGGRAVDPDGEICARRVADRAGGTERRVREVRLGCMIAGSSSEIRRPSQSIEAELGYL